MCTTYTRNMVKTKINYNNWTIDINNLDVLATCELEGVKLEREYTIQDYESITIDEDYIYFKVDGKNVMVLKMEGESSLFIDIWDGDNHVDILACWDFQI